MTLLLSVVVGVLFGCGTYLLLKGDLFRVVVGIVLIANSASLTLMASGRSQGASPILPVEGEVSDPLVQAMTVTAVVIGFAVTALLLSLVYRYCMAGGSADLEETPDDEPSGADARRHEQAAGARAAAVTGESRRSEDAA